MTRSAPLLVLLCLQATLLFSALDLLPIWTDELFTVTTVSRPIREIIPIVQRDIHPPLYYILLREWGKLPLPFVGAAALRVGPLARRVLGRLDLLPALTAEGCLPTPGRCATP